MRFMNFFLNMKRD